MTQNVKINHKGIKCQGRIKDFCGRPLSTNVSGAFSFRCFQWLLLKYVNPAGIYLLKVNNRNTKTT